MDNIGFLFDEEKQNIQNCSNKFLIKFVDFYESRTQKILVFEHFETTLKELLKTKKVLSIEEIKTLLIQINEAIKYLNKKQINKIIISPANIGINKDNIFNINSIKIFNLFPYYKLQNYLRNGNCNCRDFIYFSPEYPNDYTNNNFDINNKTDGKEEQLIINIGTKSFLWNLGLLIYELYFGELPFYVENNQIKLNLDINNLKKTNDNILNDLISKLLIKEPKKRIKWEDYINHEFFQDISLDNICKILYKKEINQNTQELDLISEEITEDNLKTISKINFNNLLQINLSNNQIRDMSIFKENSFANLRFLILADNKIGSLDPLEKNTFENLEFLSLNTNKFIDTKSFQNKNFFSLNYLSLSKNSISDISFLPVADLPNLTVLNLSNNHINNINTFRYLKTPELKELYLNSNMISQIDVFEYISFENLEILNLFDNDIKDINIFQKVSFQKTIKELYLSKNPINYFDLLNNCYFQNLEKLSLPSHNIKFHILSIKLKLYGYEFNKGDNLEDNISVIYVPLLLYQSYLMDNSNFNMFNYKNTFKITTNKNEYIPNLNQFFIENILHLDKESVKISEDNNKNMVNLNNYKVFIYFGNEQLINQQIKKTTFYLVKEFKNLHKVNDKLIRIPNYLERIENNYLLDLNCPLKERNFQKYNFGNNQNIDNIQLLPFFLQNNNYYNMMPIIFINSLYYNNFLDFLEGSQKYIKFIILKDLNKKLILSSDNNYIYKHSIDNKNIILIGDIIENVQFYKIEIIIDIINVIKKYYKGDYKKYINELIITVIDIFVDFILFIYNKKPNYYICPYCNYPILYVYEDEEINSVIINNEDNIINNEIKNNKIPKINKSQEFDYTFYNSLNVCSSLNEIFIYDFKKEFIEDYKKQYQLIKPENIYIPANPPKKGIPSINIIYHDENHKNFEQKVNQDAIRFEEISNGTFIFSNSMEILKAIMKEIYKKNSEKKFNKFLLITTGSTFEKVIKFLTEKKYLNLINKACIYCKYTENYLPLMKKYNILNGVFNGRKEIINFIKNNLSEENNVFEFSKLVTYKNYSKNYFKLHKIISKYYTKNFKNSFNIAIEILKEILDENASSDKKLIKALEVFQNNKDYEIIKEYTKNTIYPYINKWLLNLNNLAYEKAGYFIGGLMYKLNEYGIYKNKGNKNTCILYRGIYLNYLDALSYQIYNGKIIAFQTFLSTSISKKVAETFSKINKFSVEERKSKCHFSTIIEINHNFSEELFPICFDISDISRYKKEKEFLFHPYSFFRIKSFNIDLDKYILNLNLETIGKKEILEYPLKFGKSIILNEEKEIVEAN